MKRTAKFFAMLIVAALLLAGAVPAFAYNGEVVYDGNAKEFVFAPGSEYSPTDLFPDLKDVMPGDSLTQKITVRNTADKKVDVKIYMRSLGAQEGTEDFLSQLSMKVIESSDKTLFDAPADQTDGLTDWVLLGTLHSGGQTDLTVQLDVPVTIGNEFKGAIGYIDWEFKVEEIPVEEPNTGDEGLPVWPFIAGGAALVLIAILLVVFKRKK